MGEIKIGPFSFTKDQLERAMRQFRELYSMETGVTLPEGFGALPEKLLVAPEGWLSKVRKKGI